MEKNFFDAALYEVFKSHILPKATVVSATPVLSRLRMLKEPAEIECLRAAAHVADAGMAAALAAAKVGRREIEIAGETEYAMRKAGAEGWASATYVASGWRSAMAHGPASLKSIEAGDVVQVHVAPIVRGYTVDLCRTILPGDGASEAADALSAYLLAQEAGIAAAVPNTPLMEIDGVMARELESRGFGGGFLRPVFHGVGDYSRPVTGDMRQGPWLFLYKPAPSEAKHDGPPGAWHCCRVERDGPTVRKRGEEDQW